MAVSQHVTCNIYPAFKYYYYNFAWCYCRGNTYNGYNTYNIHKTYNVPKIYNTYNSYKRPV